MSSDSTGRRSWRRAVPYLLLVVLTLGSVVAVWASEGKVATSEIGPEGVTVFNVPDLAPAKSAVRGSSVDAITCRSQAKDVVKYHIHSHVAIYVNGRSERLPAGIGITTPRLAEHYPTGTYYEVGLYDCLYWIHTHSFDGIVHVEAPAKAVFTLGQLFDVWGQPLSTGQVGPARGNVVVFENGHRLSGDPRVVPLRAHSDIQIDVGSPVVPFQAFHFTVSGGCGAGTTTCSTQTTSTTMP